jgi:hypothetical protein
MNAGAANPFASLREEFNEREILMSYRTRSQKS